MPGRRKDKGGLWIVLTLVLLLAIALIFYAGRQPAGPVGQVVSPHDSTTSTIPYNGNTLTIASWNLQRFGQEKAKDAALMDYYSKVIRGYDIVILQEITDSSGDAFRELCGMLPEYTCSASARLGNSSYKEQYGLLYRNALLEAIVPGSGAYVRPPYTYRFSSGKWSFYLTTIHTDPDNVNGDLALLEKDLGSFDPADHIIIGDLNADCAYYHTPPADFTSWNWALPDGEDTTVKTSNCAYDRIIVNKGAENNYVSYGIMRNVSGEQSDHFLVYSVYRTDAS
jgi:deoxyribonuclease-1